MSKTDIWMPLHIKDYLGDTMRLNTLQHGAYLLLLMEYWTHGPLPDDDDVLCVIARMDRQKWDAEVSDAIRPYFSADKEADKPDDKRGDKTGDKRGDKRGDKTGYKLHHKRVDKELTKASDISNKRKKARQSGRQGTELDNKANGGSQLGFDNEGRQNADKTLTKPSTNTLTNEAQNSTHARVALQSTIKKEESKEEESKKERPFPSETRPAVAEEGSGISNPPPAKLPVPDEKALAFRESLGLFRALTGKTEDPSRKFLGKVLSEFGDNHFALRDLMREARDTAPVDALSWIRKAAKARANPARAPGFAQSMLDRALAAIDSAEKAQEDGARTIDHVTGEDENA
jgi:uncharacterized protein YdaU (DUF1376 family)